MRSGDIRFIEQVPPSRFDTAIEWLLVALLAFAPLAFGAVEEWSEQVVLALAAAISICFLLKLVLRKDTAFIFSWVYVPIAIFVLVVALQLIPLPTSVVTIISPNTAALKKELLSDLPNAEAALSRMTLSFYPHATKHDLRLVLAVVAVFVVVLNTYRRPAQIKRLLGAIAIIGGGIAALALAQDIFGNDKIYWFVPSYGRAHSGTFVHHGHYGQFMNLSIGAAVGLIMVKFHEAFTGKKITPSFVFDFLSSPPAKVMWLLVAMVILGAATMFVSLTRGGMVSLLIAAGLTTLVLSSRKSLEGRGWIMVLMALGAFICVLYIGFDAVYDRLATMHELDEYEGRWQIVKDIAVAWSRFPVVGTGLGTHEVVYPMFGRLMTSGLVAYAENEYAQAAEETGLIGLAALVVFGIFVWARYARNVRSAYVPIRSAAYGLGLGLLAVMLHSLGDFGQHVPANALLSAVFCSLLLALAVVGRQGQATTRLATTGKVSRTLRLVVLISVSGMWGWALLGANDIRVAQARWKRAFAAEKTLRQAGWVASDQQYIDLISNAAAAADCQPANIEYRHWLNVYRWHSISPAPDPNTGQVTIGPKGLEFVQQIVDELNQARVLCPTFGATHCVIGQLEKFVLGLPDGAERIRTGYRLAPCDPTACFVAGLLDVEGGDSDAAFAKFERASQLDGKLFSEAALALANDLDRPDLAVTLAGEDTGRLSRVANMLAGLDKHGEFAEQARSRVIELLKIRCQQSDAPARALASLAQIYSTDNDSDAAIEHYRRALVLDYGQVSWRFALARLLADREQFPEAIHEARICLRLRPEFAAAERLIADLSV
ncbi:MAG: O-antigen ligase family protein, partial [Phycisphaerales bacterium]